MFLASVVFIITNNNINFIQPIQDLIIKISQKYKNNSDFHITISNIFYNFIKIISEEKNKDINILKKLGKNYLDIIANMLKNELKISNCVILTDDFKKIIEYIISYMEQNELESVFQGIVDLFNLFEEKRINIIKKKNKKLNEKKHFIGKDYTKEERQKVINNIINRLYNDSSFIKKPNKDSGYTIKK